jgi:hypothetical protein
MAGHYETQVEGMFAQQSVDLPKLDKTTYFKKKVRVDPKIALISGKELTSGVSLSMQEVATIRDGMDSKERDRLP